MSYYQNQTFEIVLVALVFKAVLDMSNHATGFDTSDLAAKNDFIALKAEIGKVDINTLSDVLTSLNNLKTKVDDLDVGKKKLFLIDFKKLSDIVASEVVKNTKFNTLKSKVNIFRKKKFLRQLH